ncbi:MAG: EpsI family protein [Armatimonadota bacterium]|nr:EpsI family protein [bacterium]MDW8320383.1 EpsI family protein [Armatimonadota bacterium]
MRKDYRPNYVVVIAMFLLAWGMVVYARQAENRVVTFPIDTNQVPSTIAGFRMVEQQDLDDLSKQMLTPDAYIVRNYANAAGYPVNVLVIYGHRKNTFHSPGYCLPGGGWAIQKKEVERVPMVAPDGRQYEAEMNRFLLQKNEQKQVVLYCFIEGGRVTPSIFRHNWYLLQDRLLHRPAMGALLRIIVPVADNEERASEIARSFARELVPIVQHQLVGKQTNDGKQRSE